MKTFWIGVGMVVFLCIFDGMGSCEKPSKVTVCQLKTDPSAYNHKLVEIEAFVSHDFEDFTLFDPTCATQLGIWLEYGGTSKSDTIYCCGPTGGKERPSELTIENIPIPLVEDDRFRLFDKRLQPPFRSGDFGSIVHATIVGRFFAGPGRDFGKGLVGIGGYGHMGCCSLLAIQKIKSVSPQDRDDLDYGASSDSPNGCYSFETPIEPVTNVVHAQQQADLGPRAWSFDDPQRVASDALTVLVKPKQDGPFTFKETRKAPGRIVYEWWPTGTTNPQMVVVSRPYWLSFYARDSKRVAWVVIAAFELTCAK